MFQMMMLRYCITDCNLSVRMLSPLMELCLIDNFYEELLIYSKVRIVILPIEDDRN